MKQLEFVKLQINTEETILSFSEEKLTLIIQQCQGVYSKSKTSVLSLTKLIIGKLSKKEERHHINVFKLMALQTLPARAFLFNPHGYCIDEKKKKEKRKKNEK